MPNRPTKAAPLNKEAEEGAVVSELKTLQRIQQISSSWEETARLLENEFRSAQGIFTVEEDEFVGRFSKGLGGVEPARAIYLLSRRFLRAGRMSEE